MLVRLTHIIIYCSDMSRSISFYRDKMGFPVKSEFGNWIELHSGPTTLVLYAAKPASANRWQRDNAEASQARPAFEVLDLDQFYEEKKANGVEFTMPPTMQKFGQRMAVLLDPDGMPISVTEERR